MIKRVLHITDPDSQLSFPADAITQTFAILGIRGSGKTNTGVVMMEEMVGSLGQQCIVLDPTDAWHGIRSSRDGKSPGLPVYVFGGEHGDLPLAGSHGIEMANFVIDSGASVVFSMRHLSMNDQRQFAADFGERLRLLKAKSENRFPLHLFLDEAEEFVPQNLDHDRSGYAARMFGAYNRMVRRDRNIGLGITLISQRPQSVNKEPLSQIETLICHRLLHKLDRKSVKESWIEGHDTEGRGEQFLDSLASLERGQAWVWSPYWLDIFKKVTIRYRSTFDSSFTPKAGEKPRTAKVRAEVDLEALKVKLADSVEKAKNDDPRELRKQIVQLKQELLKKGSPKTEIKQVEVKVPVRVKVPTIPKYVLSAMSKLNEAIKVMDDAVTRARTEEISNPVAMNVPEITMPAVSINIQKRVAPYLNTPESSTNGDLSGPEQRILDAIAWMESIGITEPKQGAVAFLAGYTVGGGAFNNPRGRLRVNGLLEYRSGDSLALTDIGRSKAHAPSMPLDSKELQSRVLNQLPSPEQKILKPLIESYPESVENDELARRAGYEPGGGAFNNPRGRLKTLGLLEYPEKGKVKAADLLFID